MNLATKTMDAVKDTTSYRKVAMYPLLDARAVSFPEKVTIRRTTGIGWKSNSGI